MKRQAFVFNGSSYRFEGPPLAQEYSEWINDLLAKYPNAEFEFHQSLANFFSEKQEMEWVQICTLVIVTESETPTKP